MLNSTNDVSKVADIMGFLRLAILALLQDRILDQQYSNIADSTAYTKWKLMLIAT